jgi:hypothetical protein
MVEMTKELTPEQITVKKWLAQLFMPYVAVFSTTSA